VSSLKIWELSPSSSSTVC